MTRKEFMEKAGLSAFVIPACAGILAACTNPNFLTQAPTNVDFTLDVSTGNLSQNGGYLVKNGVIVARTLTGSFLAVSATCTHQGSTVQYVGQKNDFFCPSHGATYNATGQVTGGPATRSLAQYNTTLTGNSLRVFS